MLFRIGFSAIFVFAAARAGTFTDSVYPVLQKANCRACHVDNGVASATRLHFPDPDSSAEALETFGRSLSALVDRAAPEKSLLLNKPTARVKHTGGRLIAPGSKEEALLAAWVNELAKLPDSAAPAAAAPAPPALPMRRLSHTQYNNTVRDLLGDQTAPAQQFPQEDFVNGFKNQIQAQGMPALLAEAYGAAAEKLARNAFRGGDPNNLVPCKPRSAADAGCRDQFLRAFGLKVFRRPLMGGEMARYGNLLAAEARRAGNFYAGAQLVVEAMLQSPNFLFRPEAGNGPYEVGSRLSYSLWDSLPDQELFQAATSGHLGTPAEIEKQARRMLADPRAQQAVDEFVSQWLRFDRLIGTVKDRRQFPMFTSELALSMAEETRRLIDDAVWNDRNFMSVFNADYTYLNGDLASLYKIPAPASDFAKVSLPPESERAGIIGQAAFLALTAKPAETSPTARGLFIREQFLCQHVPDPPPGTNSVLPPVTEDKPVTNRERLSMHLTRETCAGCHKLIDPIGFGFEKFDAAGGRREKLKLTFFGGRKERNKTPASVELELDTNGTVAGIPDSDFKSPRELGQVLANSPQCQECVVKQLFRYVNGRPEAPADRPRIQAALARFQDSQFRFKELMIAVVTSYAGRQ